MFNISLCPKLQERIYASTATLICLFAYGDQLIKSANESIIPKSRKVLTL